MPRLVALLQYAGRYHNYAAAGDVPLGGASVRSGICLHAVVTQQLILVDLTDDCLGGRDDITQLRLTSLHKQRTRVTFTTTTLYTRTYTRQTWQTRTSTRVYVTITVPPDCRDCRAHAAARRAAAGARHVTAAARRTLTCCRRT